MNLMAHIEGLKQKATFLRQRGRFIGYLERMGIERSVLVVANALSRRFFEYNLRTFELDAREEIAAMSASSRQQESARQVVFAGFEVVVAIRRITSPDEYERCEGVVGVMPGKDTELSHVASCIERFALHSQELLPVQQVP